MNLQRFNFKIDFIIIKTLLAVAICILATFITDNYNVIFFGGVAAIVCMQHNYKHTLKSGSYRFLGTLIGAFVGILTILACSLVPQHLIGISSIIIAISSIIAIYLSNFLSLSDTTYINCVVFLNIVSNYDGKTEISQAFLHVNERVLFTALGIVAAYLVNLIAHLHKNEYKIPHVGSKIIKKIKNHKLTLDYSLGLRAFKTALAIFISAVIAYIFGSVEAIFFCGVAVVTCMQRDYKSTLSMGLFTFIGTIWGGVLGYLVVEFCNSTTRYSYTLEFLLILAAVFIVLYFCYFFNSQGMIPVTCIILLRMIARYSGTETNDNMLSFLLNPVMFFTFIGVAVAILVNVIPFRRMDTYFKSKFIKKDEDSEDGLTKQKK